MLVWDDEPGPKRILFKHKRIILYQLFDCFKHTYMRRMVTKALLLNIKRSLASQNLCG